MQYNNSRSETLKSEKDTLAILENLESTKELIKEANNSSACDSSIEGLMDQYSIPLSLTIAGLLAKLDSIFPYTCFNFGIHYFNEPFDYKAIDMRLPKSSSERFKHFLSKFGSITTIKDSKNKRLISNTEYAMKWKDKLIQVSFHVNTLLRYTANGTIETNNKLKEYIATDNATIIWNEANIDKEQLMKSINALCIIVTPAEDGYVYIRFHRVVLLINYRKREAMILN
jgi:hypothetical protein